MQGSELKVGKLLRVNLSRVNAGYIATLQYLGRHVVPKMIIILQPEFLLRVLETGKPGKPWKNALLTS
jgi:hypothetical protein